MNVNDRIFTSPRFPLNAKLSNVRRTDYSIVIETVPEYLARVLTYDRPLAEEVYIYSPSGEIALQDIVSGAATLTFKKYRFTGGVEDADFIEIIEPYEPAFTKNTAFNKNFGTTAGTVLEGRTFGTAANSATTDFAPASGSGNYIQNQNASAQSANMWINGNIKLTPAGIGLSFSRTNAADGMWTQYRNELGSETAFLGVKPNTDLFTINDQFSLSYNSGAATFESTIQATTAKLTNLTDGYLPYHISDASGLGNSTIHTDGSKIEFGAESGYWFGYYSFLYPTIGTTNRLVIGGVPDGTYNPRAFIDYTTTTTSQLVEFNSLYTSGTDYAKWAFMNGNVGIGYSTGTEITNNKLAVNGSVFFNGNVRSTSIGESFRISEPSSTNPYSLAITNAGGSIYFGMEGGTAGGYFTGSNSYEAVIYSPSNNLYIKTPNAKFTGTVNSIGYLLNGNNLFSSLSSGKITQWDGTKFTPITDGTNGQVLTTNGAGVYSFGTQNIAGSFSQVGAATTVFTVTIGRTMANTAYKVNVTPTSVLGAALFYVTNKTTTTFDVTYLAGLTGTVTFDWVIFP